MRKTPVPEAVDGSSVAGRISSPHRDQETGTNRRPEWSSARRWLIAASRTKSTDCSGSGMVNFLDALLEDDISIGLTKSLERTQHRLHQSGTRRMGGSI